MKSDYQIRFCEDYDLIREISLDPEILARTADDFFVLENYKLELDGAWLRCDRSDECVGLVKIKYISPLDIGIHIHIPKKHRINCLKIGLAFLTYIERHRAGYVKLSTRVAMKYPQIIKYVERLGFTFDGIDRVSFKKNGVLYDTALFSYVF